MTCGIVKKAKSMAACLKQMICGNGRELERRVSKLEEKLREIEKSCQQQRNQIDPPVVIEHVNVEKIMFDKVELNNNFGSLGIKALSGVLNIGANYGAGTLPSGEKKQTKVSPPPKAGDNKQQEQAPKYTIGFK